MARCFLSIALRYIKYKMFHRSEKKYHEQHKQGVNFIFEQFKILKFNTTKICYEHIKQKRYFQSRLTVRHAYQVLVSSIKELGFSHYLSI